ncbi:MAG: iron-containing alcohol dehydrogenase [Spirochaetes bacterium]|nr:iron-containing alcohol dehydrogenase [Spirochaetota bacterium]
MSVGTYNVWPRKLIIGSGTVKTLGSEIKALGKKRVIVFTDNALKEFPIVKNLISMLKGENLEVSFFGEIGPNPTDEMVHNAVKQMKNDKPEAIVCIGGGSPIDAAKAANVVYTHGGTVDSYDIAIGGIERITPKLLPFIAIPTTAGTGSEVTWVAVITDTKKHLKFGVISPLLVPDISLLDAELTLSLPPEMTAYTGMDALTHCIESYCSIVHFNIADAMAIHGMKMISRSLKTAVKDGKNLKAREDMLEASMMAGASFNVNNLGLCHQMAHQLSAYFNLPHGLANAVLLPRVMSFNLSANFQKFADIAEAMGADIRGLSLQAAAEKSVEMVEKLSAEVGIPKYLDDIGVTKDKVPAMVKTALADAVGSTNPKQTTPEECEQVFMKAFKS